MSSTQGDMGDDLASVISGIEHTSAPKARAIASSRVVRSRRQWGASNRNASASAAFETLSSTRRQRRSASRAAQAALSVSSATYTIYAISHGPIPLSGPTRFVYDKLKDGGMSAMDSSALIKASIITGLDIAGLHAQEEKTPQPKQMIRRNQVARQLLRR